MIIIAGIQQSSCNQSNNNLTIDTTRPHGIESAVEVPSGSQSDKSLIPVSIGVRSSGPVWGSGAADRLRPLGEELLDLVLE